MVHLLTRMEQGNNAIQRDKELEAIINEVQKQAVLFGIFTDELSEKRNG